MLELESAIIVFSVMARFQNWSRFVPHPATEDDHLRSAAESALETLRKGHVRVAEGILSSALRQHADRRR